MTMPLPSVFEPKEWPLVIHFTCWRPTYMKWVEWVDALRDRLFEGDVTTRYAKWWKQSVLPNQHDFAKNIVQRKRTVMLMCLLIDLLVKRLKTVPSGNSAQDGFKDNENIHDEVPARCKNLSNQSSSASTADYENAKRMSPQAKLVGKDSVEPLILKEEEWPLVIHFTCWRPTYMKWVEWVDALRDRLFEGDVTTRYAKWWKQSVLPNQHDFAKNIVQRKRTVMLMCLLIDLLVKRLKTVPSGNYAQDGFKDNENIHDEVPARCKNLSNQSSSASTADYENAKRMSPQAKLVGKDSVEPLILKEEVENANWSIEASLSGAQGESYNCVSGINVIDLEHK
ncbi:hypothetical protein DEO72_LG8g2367 [Vigna unguiculata]|uniref:Uncharacterized protein n=1 Tax=Vigna unguiculata TaxID=3917 RepID=A0A4D6MUN3_VIGUN|nr:hypothetical protein DEO72_LG8g2367 [Vigna unguiculata]